MKPNFNLIAFLFLCTVLSCKNETALSEYKFSDQEAVLNCEGQDSKLLNEALYAFEGDLKTFFKNNYTRNGDLYMFYSQFIPRDVKGMVPYEELMTPHTLEVFNVLKTKKDLWNPENTVSKLNYNSSFFNCIATNVQDKDLKTTLNALLATHSMSPRLFTAPLITQYRKVADDPYLRAYVAFDLFYAKLFDIDATKIKERENVDSSLNLKVPNTEK
ncbi:MAG TPA: hypothetical protein VGA80_17315 [Flavobacteriaceae bacterium]|jgi:hypothetical protein